VLRIARCADCGAYTHPPLPRCRVCRSDQVALAPVSGRAVVAGFTVNHQQWLPDFPPPYVIAVVALEEDDGVRLTTNIVNCPPEDVRIGMPVRVLFEKAGDVYLPLFEPQEPQHPDIERSRLTLPVPADRDVGPARPRASAVKFEERVALTGVGQSRVGRRLMTDPLRLTVDACVAAVADAGLDLDEIDGLSTYPGRIGSRRSRRRCSCGRPGSTASATPPGRAARSWPRCSRSRPGCAATCCATARSGSPRSPS